MTPDALIPLETSFQEIADLFERYSVALADASLVTQSADGRYVDAYTAGFLLAKIAVRAAGYRVKGGDNHRDTISSLRWVIGSAVQPSADALDSARKRRNADLYDGAGLVSDVDVGALLRRVATLEGVVRDWLTEKHPELVSAGRPPA